MGTWREPDVGRPIAAPLERSAPLLGIDLATIVEAATKVEPYIRAESRSGAGRRRKRSTRPPTCAPNPWIVSAVS